MITVKAETEEARETEVTQTIKELLNKLEEIEIKAEDVRKKRKVMKKD